MSIIAFLRLFRPLNLAFIVLTQYLIYYCIIRGLFQFFVFDPSLNHLGIALLSLSTVLVAAGGYLINDYLDFQVDSINKPVTQEREIAHNRSLVLGVYALLSSLGVIIAFGLAFSIGHYQLAYIHLLMVAGLWFYSTIFQKWPLIGNVLVSLMIAMVVIIVGLYEVQLLDMFQNWLKSGLAEGLNAIAGLKVSIEDLAEVKNEEILAFIWSIIVAFAVFAFLINLIREVVKDIEDIEGDSQYDYKTLPIVTSRSIAGFVASGFALLTVYLIKDFQTEQLELGEFAVAVLAFFLIQIPLFACVYLIWKGRAREDFEVVSKILKATMFAGLLYLPYLLFTMNLNVPDPQITVPEGYEIIGTEFDEIEEDPEVEMEEIVIPVEEE